VPAFEHSEVARSFEAVNEARQRFQDLAELYPSVPHHLDWVAECDLTLSRLHAQQGSPAEAAEKAERAKDLRSGPILARWKNTEPLCRAYERAKSLNEAAFGADALDGIRMYREASAICESLVDAFPNCKGYRDWLGANKGGSAKRLSKIGARVDAEADFAISIRLRRELRDSEWRSETTKCKLANTLYSFLQTFDRLGTTLSHRKKFRASMECCQLYREVLTEQYGLEWVTEYLEALDCLLGLANSAAERECVDREIELAQAVTYAANADPVLEYKASKLLADRRAKLRPQHIGVSVSRGIQFVLCLLVFGLTGLFSFPLFCAVALPCALCVRLIGTAEKGFAVGRVRDLLSTCVMPCCLLFGELHGYELAGGLLGIVVYLVATAMVRGQLLRTHSHRMVAICARVSRRADSIAERWALWIANHGTPWLKALMLDADVAHGSPRLRRPFYWAAGFCAVSWEAQELCAGLVALVNDFVEPASRPQKPRFTSRRQNQSTSWAVLLRRPLHLARGDDVPLCT